jgi:type I restriction enzyme S subunit
MNAWAQTQLKSVALKITKGTTPTTLGFDFTQDGINFIKAESISRDGGH